MKEKLTKLQAGYIHRPESDYRCVDCVFLKTLGSAQFRKDREFAAGCAYFGPADPVSPQRGGCIYVTPGDPTSLEIPWLCLFTKEELAYSENRNGFGCGRCEHFAPLESDCSKVDKGSPGPTPGEINLRACCDLQEPDKERGKLSREDLDEFIANLERRDPAKAKDLDDYAARRKAEKERTNG